MRFTEFLRTKLFIRHLALALVLFLVILWISMLWLKVYTRHGREYSIPDYTGMTMEEIRLDPENGLFRFVVIDSVYKAGVRKGTVYTQDPLPGSKVKKLRVIYVTLVAIMPEMVPVPNLKDLSLRQAVNLLDASKLKLGGQVYAPSFDKNAVLDQRYRGKSIVPGTLLERDSRIDLVLGDGRAPEAAGVPFLIGKTRDEAFRILQSYGFNLGIENYLDDNDPGHSRVYQQYPHWNSREEMFSGDSVNLWFRSDMNFNFEALVDSLHTDTLTN